MKNKLPKNWVETDLDTVVLRMTNGSSLKQEEEPFEGSLPISRIETIWNETIDLDRVKYVDASEDDIEKYGLQKGDVLFSHINSDKHLGKTAVFNLDQTIIHGINLLLLRAMPQFDGDLLNYILRHYRFSGKFIEVAQRSVNQSSINQKKLKSFLVPLAPLAEQQRIVAKLDELFGHLDILKTRINNIPQILKKFRQAVLTQAVTGKLTENWRVGKELDEWKEDILGNLIIGTPKNGAYYHRSLYGSGTRIIRIDCFYDGALKNWDVVQYVEIPESDKAIYGLAINDILINRVNSIQYLGKCMLVDSLPEDCIYESNMMRITCDTEIITPKYLKTYLISYNGLEELRKNAKHSVNQASINQQDVKSVIVNFPPKEEQFEIVKRVEHLFEKAGAIEAQYQTLKTKIESLPQAILSKAFKGELVPQLLTDGDSKVLLKEIQKLKTSLRGTKQSVKRKKK
jgi:type I restriction enzyme S subunit